MGSSLCKPKLSAAPNGVSQRLDLSLTLQLPPPPQDLLDTPVTPNPAYSPLPPPPDDVIIEKELTVTDGWVELLSEDGEIYYYNESTQQTQWEKPNQDVGTVQAKPKLYKKGWQVKVGDNGAEIYLHPQTSEKWMACADSNGKTYYYSLTDAGKTAWSLPEVKPVPSPRTRLRQRAASDGLLLSPIDTSPKSNKMSSDFTKTVPASSSSSVGAPPATATRSVKRRAPDPPGMRSASVSQSPAEEDSQTKSNSLRRNTYSPGHRRQLSAPIEHLSVGGGAKRLSQDSDPFLSPSEPGLLPPSSSSLSSVTDGKSDELSKHKEFLGMSGNLQRKKLADSHGKKCSQRNWTQHFVVLNGVHLMFYKDKKQAKEQKSGSKLSLPSNFCLQRIQLVIPDYAKRKNVMQLISPTGEQMYLQAESSTILVDWMTAINEAIVLASSMPPLLNNRKSSVVAGTADDEMFLDDLMDGPERKGRVKVKLKSFLARRPTYEEMKKKGLIKEQVFGSHIVHLAEREKTVVPSFVRLCIDAIDQRGLETVGIYRVPGNASQIQRLRYKIDREETINLNDRKQWDDINVVAGSLKLFFRELAEPLVPFAQYGPFVEYLRNPDRATKIAAFRKEILKMHQANRETLRVLLEHLTRVVAKGSVNKMQSQNVAIVFGPTLLRPEVESGNMAANMAYQNAIVDFFLKECNELFAK
ncbi:rho GTPase-activating protein 15-like isoform X2 [Corticium candelabrum]|uniref:rho GTPase-activating protein 15-like isoform X2 n=1 Tax=Corticium candelabrum TaxID=121492 RepID=UPI002E26744A|nr:rho GTPase-activating protein 15-like isoform X2 [Corticium candelabrum]